LLSILAIFTWQLVTKKIISFITASAIRLQKLFAIPTIRLLRSYSVTAILVLSTRYRLYLQVGQSFQLLNVFLLARCFILVLALSWRMRARSAVYTVLLIQYLPSN
jgi:hypothetical protein